MRGRGASDSAPAQGTLVLLALILVAAVANLNLAVANVALPDIGKAFDSSQTTLNLDRGRLLARSRGVGAVPRRARRPLRAQDDADPRRAAVDPGLPPRGVRTDRRGAHRSPASSAGSRPAWPTPPRSRSSPRCGPGQARTKSIALWSAIGGAISALGPLVAGALLEHFWWGSVFLVTLPLAVVALVLAAEVRAQPRQRGDRPGRQPRRRPLRADGRRAHPRRSTSPPFPTRARSRSASASSRRRPPDRVRDPPAPAAQPALRPRHRRAPHLLGRGVSPGSSCSARSWRAMFIGQQFLQNVLGYSTLEAGRRRSSPR